MSVAERVAERVGVADLEVAERVGVADLEVAERVGVADLGVAERIGVADLGVADLGVAERIGLGDTWTVVPREARASVRPASRLLRRVRWAWLATLWTLAGVALGLIASVTLPMLLGYRSLTVLSGSMEPTLHVGDVVVVKQVSPIDVRVGDIVSFRDPTDDRRLITHRVRHIQVEGGSVRFATKGDANTSVEHWRVPVDGTLGRASYRVPLIGYVVFWIRGRYGRLLLLVLPALALGVYELNRIWRPKAARSQL